MCAAPPEPLPARIGRLVRRYSPDLAARIAALALELHTGQAHRLLDVLLDVDAEASDAARSDEPAALAAPLTPRAPQALRQPRIAPR